MRERDPDEEYDRMRQDRDEAHAEWAKMQGKSPDCVGPAKSVHGHCDECGFDW